MNQMMDMKIIYVLGLILLKAPIIGQAQQLLKNK